MQGLRIVNCGGHTLFLQVSAQRVPVGTANYKLIEDMPAMGRHKRKRDVFRELMVIE